MFRKALFLLLILGGAYSVMAQTTIDTFAVTSSLDTARFWLQIPASYDRAHPPALLAYWHGNLGSQHDLTGFPEWGDQANQRGWILAAHFGPNNHHWNARRAQEHYIAMLDWLSAAYPFCLDSIYIFGGSMGGAAGQIYHNNNCGLHDYFTAATASGSPILDCQKRQEQYFAGGDTMRTMREIFGGIPADGPTVCYEYHRYSAMYFGDSTKSMHPNSYHLPVWCTWGTTVLEDSAYGQPVLRWRAVRDSCGADTTWLETPTIANHGLYTMPAAPICDWLSRFTANRYPDDLSIVADESDDYYWTHATLAHSDTVFGRYEVQKNFSRRSLDLNLIRNIDSLNVLFAFPWSAFDTLKCTWYNLDTTVHRTYVGLSPVPRVTWIDRLSGDPVQWTYQDSVLNLDFAGRSEFLIYFDRFAAGEPHSEIPATLQLVSAYPNPFNSRISLNLQSSRNGSVELLVYDLLGRLAASRSIAVHQGMQRITYDADGLGTGTYFVKLSGTASAPLKITLLK
jgi:hypothetical protein